MACKTMCARDVHGSSKNCLQMGDGRSKRRASGQVVILRLVPAWTQLWANASGGGPTPITRSQLFFIKCCYNRAVC